jgi:hypothetical protein
MVMKNRQIRLLILLQFCILEQSALAADFAGASLSGAHLTNADLRGSNLSGANLTGANLSGTDLRGTMPCRWRWRFTPRPRFPLSRMASRCSRHRQRYGRPRGGGWASSKAWTLPTLCGRLAQEGEGPRGVSLGFVHATQQTGAATEADSVPRIVMIRIFLSPKA